MSVFLVAMMARRKTKQWTIYSTDQAFGLLDWTDDWAERLVRMSRQGMIQTMANRRPPPPDRPCFGQGVQELGLNGYTPQIPSACRVAYSNREHWNGWEFLDVVDIEWQAQTEGHLFGDDLLRSAPQFCKGCFPGNWTWRQKQRELERERRKRLVELFGSDDDGSGNA